MDGMLQDIGHVASVLTVISAVIAAVTSSITWWRLRQEGRRRQEEVRVLVSLRGGPPVELPLALRRGEFSRAELMGRLGMFAKDQSKNLRIKAFASPGLLRQIVDVIERGASSVTVECEQDELDQIDLSSSRAPAA